jgi:hypothetical protein
MAQTLETTQQEGLLDALARKWRIWQRRRAAIAELAHCGSAERQRIANDIGMNEDELPCRQMAGHH